ncbi:MAG: hypothetical protein GY797_33405 [Deltaproteobacteria bacterium]|nr:hypothetical protein [Deltaproteobacteria bacterium]
MLKDKNTMMSDDQAVTATAASTDYIDALSAGNALGKQLWLDVRVKTSFTAGGSATMTIALQTDDNSSFSSATTLWSVVTVAVASLVAGLKYRIPIPFGAERYLRMNYTVATGPMTAGAIDAAIVHDIDATIED